MIIFGWRLSGKMTAIFCPFLGVFDVFLLKMFNILHFSCVIFGTLNQNP